MAVIMRLLTIVCLFLFMLLYSCSNDDNVHQDTTMSDQSEKIFEETTANNKLSNVERIDTHIFNKYTPLKIDKDISYSDYEGGKIHNQKYTLHLYKSISNFTDIYSGKQFNKVILEYEERGLVQVYKQYLYFHVIEKDGANNVLQYNMDDGTQKIIFSYTGEYQIAIRAVNDDYLIWQEDENANWLKVTLNCYNIKTGANEKILTYSRDENGYMYSWNFNRIILEGANVYFTEKYIDKKAYINLYKYDILNKKLELIDEKWGLEPFIYKGISWLSYDDNKKEYLIKNLNSHMPEIYLGSDYVKIYASPNIVVGYKNFGKDGIMYYDGKNSIPIIESTTNIDEIYCTDSFITWDGWSNDFPLFYDINKETIIYVDCLEEGKHYMGYVSDDYLVFGAHNYIPDLTISNAITTKSLVYYYIKTEELT